MGDSAAASEVRPTNLEATSSVGGYTHVLTEEEFEKRIAELKRRQSGSPSPIVPCKSRSSMYASFKHRRLESKFGEPAGRMFACGVIKFDQPLWGGAVNQVHEGRLGRKNVIIKTVDLAQEKGIEGLPYLLQEARVYEDLQRLTGKCLPKFLAKFYGSGIVDNEYAVVVEKVPGRMLRNLGNQEKEECRARVLEAYDALHDAGYVQGDVSASNVLVDKKRVTIIDFGLAKKVGKSSEEIGVEKRSVLHLFD